MTSNSLLPSPGRGAVLRAAASAVAVGLVLAGCSPSGDDGGDQQVSAEAQQCNDIDESFPARPLELVVPFAAGGGTDGVARIIADELSAQMDAQINVVNRDGGAGIIGHQAIADADPDGYTLGLVTVEIGMMHHQGLTDLSGDDLTAISQMNEDGAGITVAADSEWDDVDDLLDHIRENPGEVTSSGTVQGGIWHLALLGMLLDAGISPDAITFVPATGAAPALQELAAGGLDMTTNSLAESRTMLEADRAKAIGVMGSEPDPLFPEVETLAEQTGSEYSMSAWRGIAGPEDMDESVVEELECHLGVIAESEDYKDFMTESGLGVVYRDAEDFQTFMREDDAAKGEIMQEAGLAR